MLDQMTFRAINIARAKAFYSAALEPLGTAYVSKAILAQTFLGLPTQTHLSPWDPAGLSRKLLRSGCH